jgi:RimJ/RimL family protein N-acetyltransferase
MLFFLETERLWLRQFTEADVDNLFDLDSDPEVMRFVNGGAPTPRAAIEADILPSFLGYYERFAGYGFWAAIEKASGEFLGWFHFRPLEGAGPGEVELGYRLRKAAWGQGYGTEASRALIRKGFTELGVRRVVASTFADNLASRRVMEKAGLTLVRTYRTTPADNVALYGITCSDLFEKDDVEYALDKADWEQQEVADAQPVDTEVDVLLHLGRKGVPVP